jgi:hypothetical protein
MMDMSEETDELIQALDGARNFMTGMSLDPRLPSEINKALLTLATKIVKKYEG